MSKTMEEELLEKIAVTEEENRLLKEQLAELTERVVIV